MIAFRPHAIFGRRPGSWANAIPATILCALVLSYALLGWVALYRPDWLAFGGMEIALLLGPAALLSLGKAMLALYLACSVTIVLLALLGAWKSSLRVLAALGIFGVWVGAALFAIAMSI
ncbi:hypothetical protein P6166_09515 [Stenotrophomonas sp. HITSZ_GD]|uniref:hypothetical protein n=1 Tax=Stenotrophomonas sp. HITSZ_GD TaxID=3037248 RepID=UPI00240E4903|nr:hypothetical protein [Stenotrophomonas sp. HITSZ_GD]MDG2525591.1 hypothetical protein [Stenotrophomonas sp. HITSZ_GD]